MIGAQGVPLTPGRSIAVDRLREYGTPFFIEANLPIERAKHISPFRRLMIAQDAGSATVGPARADLYWGAGDDAGHIAGCFRHSGRFVMLLPRELDMIEAGRQMPLPTPKPKIPEVEVNKLGKDNSIIRASGRCDGDGGIRCVAALGEITAATKSGIVGGRQTRADANIALSSNRSSPLEVAA